MKILINDVEPFKSALKNIELLSDSTDFLFEENGLKLSVLSRGHTIFYECLFDKSFFMEYECDKMSIFSLDSHELTKILKKCKGDELSLTFYETCCIIQNGSKKFTLSLLDKEYRSNPGFPNIPYLYSVQVPISFIKESLKDSEMFSKDIYIKTLSDSVVLSCFGVMGKYSNEYHCDKELESTDSKYSIEKIRTVLGADKVSDKIRLKGGNDLPLMMEIVNDSEDVRITGLIAQIIEIEE